MKRKDGLTCTGTSKQTKQRCGNPPIRGGTVCKFHGGGAPQVKAAAHRRELESLVGPALAEMARILEDSSVPDGVKFSAVKDVLDRCGFKPSTVVEVLSIGVVEAEIARLEALEQ